MITKLYNHLMKQNDIHMEQALEEYVQKNYCLVLK